MRILIVASVLLYVLVSCNKSNVVDEKLCQEYNIEQYKFCIPNNWVNKENTKYDSKIFLFVNKRDSIVISSGVTNIIDDPIVVDNQKEKETLL